MHKVRTCFWFDGNGAEAAQFRCGWLKDRFGVSWQIVPRALLTMLTHPDRPAADRAMRAMLTMARIDIAAIEAAFKNQEGE